MKTRSRVKLGDTIELLDDPACLDPENELSELEHKDQNHDDHTPEQVVQNDHAKQCTLVGHVTTRSKARLGDTVDLLYDSDTDSNDADRSSTGQDYEIEEPLQIGYVGYTFQKQFNQGWFTGKVIEIRHGAGQYL
jgi:hypothetical protein